MHSAALFGALLSAVRSVRQRLLREVMVVYVRRLCAASRCLSSAI